MEICLVRHGETDWNKVGKIQGHTDIELNENGIRQAYACAEYLNNAPFELIITSPLKRAKQTAEIIAEKKNIPIIEMRQFIERSFGDAEGMTVEARLSKFPDLQYTNQESKEDLRVRVMNGLHKIQKERKESTIVLVAHSAVINSILAILSNGEIGSGKTQLANACLSTIYYNEGIWKIKNYNQVEHLKVSL
ncbi:histidine phosphatase family protein [Solibacillus sp. FSL W7-1464]|uniref:histidine phosphatase family protein n=1 Tax=Solibacillus sp. FSL W7-1464 TaxID=2921706 RepID=UPI0030FA7E42